MKIVVHRGTGQIGGTCVELEHDGHRLILDVGLPLEGSGKDQSRLPPVPGLFSDALYGHGIDGVLISHAHQDHHGLLGHVRKEIPIHATRSCRALIEMGDWFFGQGQEPRTWSSFEPFKPFVIGPFTVTAYLVDHSAFDACAFLVEAGGVRVFYSGDFRGHGRKSRLFDELVRNPPRDIDCLLMEGTMLGRTGESVRTEEELEHDFEQICRQSKGPVLCTASSMNIDRLVSLYRASLRSGRTMVLDIFTAMVLKRLCEVSKARLPHLSPDYPSLKVWFPWSWSRLLVRNHGAEVLYPYRPWKLDKKALAADGAQLVVLVKPSVLPDLERTDFAAGEYVYSQWSGSYLETRQVQLSRHLQDRGFATHFLHTSGHATLDDLGRLVKALAPRYLIPIHTEHPGKYEAFGVAVRLLGDGEEWFLAGQVRESSREKNDA